MRRLLAIAMVAATVVAIGAGCGGEGSADAGSQEFSVVADTTMTTGTLPTKARFIARVNQICRSGWKVILQNFHEYSSWQDSNLSKQQVFAKSVRLSYLAGVDFHIFDEIQTLGAPKGEEPGAEAVIGTLQTAVERGLRVVSVPTTAKLKALFAEYNRVAGEYGFDECLVGGSHLPKVAPPV